MFTFDNYLIYRKNIRENRTLKERIKKDFEKLKFFFFTAVHLKDGDMVLNNFEEEYKLIVSERFSKSYEVSNNYPNIIWSDGSYGHISLDAFIKKPEFNFSRSPIFKSSFEGKPSLVDINNEIIGFGENVFYFDSSFSNLQEDTVFDIGSTIRYISKKNGEPHNTNGAAYMSYGDSGYNLGYYIKGKPFNFISEIDELLK
jgi:hypothetical protein